MKAWMGMTSHYYMPSNEMHTFINHGTFTCHGT